MDWKTKQRIDKHAMKIVALARTHPTPSSKVAEILTATAVNAMDEERRAWQQALHQKGIGPKTRDKIMRIVRGESDG